MMERSVFAWLHLRGSHPFFIWFLIYLIVLGSERSTTQYQLIIDLLDVWLPATALGIVNVNDGIAGTLGCVICTFILPKLRSSRFISSLMALRTQWAAVTSK